MLNLLRSDLYRITRIRGMRGALWQYLSVVLGAAILEVGLNALVLSQGLGSLAALDPQRDLAAPSAFLGPALLGNVSIVGIASTFGMIEYLFADLNDGFIKSLTSSLRGRSSYFLEKVAFAGIWSAIMVAAGAAFHLLCAWLLLALPLGVTFTGLDGAAELGAWLAGIWLATWALTVISMACTLLLRKKLPTYVFAFTLVMGVVPMLVATAALFAGQSQALAPIAPTLNAVAAWMPSTVLEVLGYGAAGILDLASPMPLAEGPVTWLYSIFGSGPSLPVFGPLPIGAWAVLVGALWVAAGSALFVLVVRRRSV